MTDNFEKKVAVDGPVVNAGELGSSTFSCQATGFAVNRIRLVTWPAMDGGAHCAEVFICGCVA